jgi:hypothetical protein
LIFSFGLSPGEERVVGTRMPQKMGKSREIPHRLILHSQYNAILILIKVVLSRQAAKAA